MTAEANDPDNIDVNAEELHRRLVEGRGGGEVVDSPSNDGCWHDDQFFAEGTVATIDAARVVCRAGIWKPFDHSFPAYLENVDDSNPSASEEDPLPDKATAPDATAL